MSKNKIQIDALPCTSDTFSAWYWAMIGGVVVSLIILLTQKSGIDSSILLYGVGMPIVSIPGLIFTLIFAKALKPVSSTLNMLWIINAIISYVTTIVNSINVLTHNQHLVGILIFNGILSVVSLGIFIAIFVIICGNYSGTLGKFGRNLWLTPLIILGVALGAGIIIGLIRGAFNSSYGVTPPASTFSMVVMIGCAIFCVYLIYTRILRLMYELLQEGFEGNLTPTEMEYYIACESNRKNFWNASGPSNQQRTEVDRNFEPNPYPNNKPKDNKNNKPEDNKNKNRNLILIIAGSFILGGLIAGAVFYFVSNNKHEVYDEWDDWDYEEGDTAVPDEPLEDTDVVVTDEYVSDDPSLPAWLPDDFARVMSLDGISPMSESEFSKFRDSLYEDTYSGYVREYPITLKITEINNDGTFRGRYAYNSTLKKYGNKPKNWFNFEGSFMNGYFGSFDYKFMAFKAYKANTNELYEYWLLRYDENDTWSGEMVNVIHCDDPDPAEYYYDVTLTSDANN